jgi:hypothetical protein
MVELPQELASAAWSATELSLNNFANLIGVDPSTVTRWASGRYPPNTVARALLKLIAADPEFCVKVLRDEISRREGVRELPPVPSEELSESARHIYDKVHWDTWLRGPHSIDMASLRPHPLDMPRAEQDRALLELEEHGLIVLEPFRPIDEEHAPHGFCLVHPERGAFESARLNGRAVKDLKPDRAGRR